MSEEKDIITRCAERFLVVLAEGDADAGHYDEDIHALCLGAPEVYRWLIDRYGFPPHDEWDPEGDAEEPEPPEPAEWTADAMAEIIDKYFEIWMPADMIDDGDDSWAESLSLASELAAECSDETGHWLLDIIDEQLDAIDREDQRAEEQARAEVEAAGLEWDTCLVGLAWAA